MIVHYKGKPMFELEVGQPAYVHPIDHPSELVSNTKLVKTSLVTEIHKDGTFRTENTLYIHCGQDN